MKLIETALAMRDKARAPYSEYKVGAAVLTEDGTIVGGCNVENASYGLSMCAERVTLFKAVAEGHARFKALAVATDNGGPPCGACRQVIWELCGNIPVYICKENGAYEETTSAILLPAAFDVKNLA